MDRGITVFGNDALGDQDRIFEVIAVPRHERDQHVLTEGEFALVGRRAIGNHIALGDHITDLDHRALVDVRVLVGTGVFGQVVDIDTDFTRYGLVIVHTDDDTTGVNVVNLATTAGNHGSPRVDCDGTLDAGTHQRLFRTQARNRLTLHVGAHQCAVRVIVLKERNQRGGDGNDLAGGHVHVLDT